MEKEVITVTTEEAAWKTAVNILGCAYRRDITASHYAGYPVYRGISNGQCRIYDLGSRLVLDIDGDVRVIHIA